MKRFFAFFLFLILLNAIYSLTFNFPFEFGVEGGNIATNIAAGNGFSNPFDVITGPTAWVAPILPYMIAFFMKLFGVSFTAFAIMTVIKMLSFAASLILIIKSMEFSGIKVNFPGILFLYILSLLSD